MKSSQNYARKIRALGYRFTPQRQLILDTLIAMDGHASVNQIYDEIQTQAPEINRSTIYRTLNFLRDLQIVSESELHGQTVYEMTEETPHHHLVCRCCGSVEMLEDYHFQELVDHLVEGHGFKAELNHLTLSGLCAHCQEQEAPCE